MYRVLEIIRTSSDNKESQSLYEFTDYISAKGEYETKLGADMKSALYNGYILILFDDNGTTYDNASKGEGFSPRLIDVLVRNGSVIPTVAKYETVNDVHGNYHSKWGAAIKNTAVSSIMLYGIGDKGQQICFKHWVRPQ